MPLYNIAELNRALFEIALYDPNPCVVHSRSIQLPELSESGDQIREYVEL